MWFFNWKKSRLSIRETCHFAIVYEFVSSDPHLQKKVQSSETDEDRTNFHHRARTMQKSSTTQEILPWCFSFLFFCYIRWYQWKQFVACFREIICSIVCFHPLNCLFYCLFNCLFEYSLYVAQTLAKLYFHFRSNKVNLCFFAKIMQHPRI